MIEQNQKVSPIESFHIYFPVNSLYFKCILLAIGLCFLIPVEAQITFDKSFDTGDTVIMILADSLVYEGV